MKRRIDIKSLTLGALLGAGIVFSIAAAVPDGGRTVWEYKTTAGRVIGDESKLDAAINALVSQGWEFVVASQAADHYGFAVLRREKK